MQVGGLRGRGNSQHNLAAFLGLVWDQRHSDRLRVSVVSKSASMAKLLRKQFVAEAMEGAAGEWWKTGEASGIVGFDEISSGGGAVGPPTGDTRWSLITHL